MNLSTNRLRALLARYEAAETTVEEERELKALLHSPDLPSEFRADAAFFGVQQVLAKAEMPLRAETTSAPWNLDVAQTPKAISPAGVRLAHRRKLWRITAIAATLLVAIVASLFLFSTPDSSSQPIAQQSTTVDWSKYEVTNPEEATRITRAAFATVSQGIESGGRITSKGIGRIEPIHYAIKAKS